METALVLDQALGFIGLVFLVGAWLFREVFLPEADVATVRRARWSGVAGALLVVVAAVVQMCGTVYLAMGDMAFDDVVGFAHDTHPGRALVVRPVLALLLLLPGLIRHAGGRRVAVVLLCIGLLGTFTTVSHATEVGGVLAPGADELHLFGAVCWAGGLWYFSWLGPALARQGALAGMVGRLSDWSMGSVCTLAVTGVYAAWIHLDSLSALFDTTYGRILCGKVAIVALTIGVGAYDREKLVPHASEQNAALRLCRTVLLESILLVIVLGLTGWLTRTDTGG